jgi:Uma2 family endonuclease
MSTATRAARYTFEDFCAISPPKQKADLIDGVIYVASPDNTDADDIFVWLMRLLGDFLEMTGLGGRVFGSRVAFRLGDKNGPESDLAYVRSRRLHLVQRGFVEGPPDVAIEIVSPDSIERDYHQKRELYQKAGVREYWIIDELTHKVTFLRLDRQGEYREVRPRKGQLHSRVLPGFWFRPEWLWVETRPSKTEALRQILA